MASHFDVAAYALGTLDARGTEAFEGHLASCANCQVELFELQELPGLLDTVAETWPDAPVRGAVIYGLPTKRRRFQHLGAATAAAVLVFLSGAVTAIGFLGWDGADPPAASEPPTALTRLDPVAEEPGGVRGSLESSTSHAWVETTPEGSRIALDLGGITGSTPCSAVVVSRAGETTEIALFDPPKKGERVVVSGTTPYPVAQIDRVEVRRVSSGKIITTLKAPEK
ncbi:zf-HC2 domain-containing protein [Actinokineospora xionganensis]|uniref:Zf-HC2 domain-containing protein n=1 Tax=Actinokineospora xionganensis TaxID=2684470 RepID=A0ABR7LA60_9PSEU|nr:zf-HC2 domain-containing protein [Actinokineospora xionganensis]MBC6449550.1 zf-HC2 domain-containing protein [Actinokineospora xionganensis]